MYVLLVAALNVGIAGEAADHPRHDLETIELFNGKDLSGWVNVNCAPDTWTVRDGMIVCTGHPRGFLRTENMYENYVLEVEWRHVNEGGNAGIMVHADALPQTGAPYPCSVEVQVKDGDHGSIFGIRGCTVMALTNPRSANRAQPLEQRAKPAGQWNRFIITTRGDRVTVVLNGQTVIDKARLPGVPECGPIGLQNHGDPIEFRNLFIKPLESGQ